MCDNSGFDQQWKGKEQSALTQDGHLGDSSDVVELSLSRAGVNALVVQSDSGYGQTSSVDSYPAGRSMGMRRVKQHEQEKHDLSKTYVPMESHSRKKKKRILTRCRFYRTPRVKTGDRAFLKFTTSTQHKKDQFVRCSF